MDYQADQTDVDRRRSPDMVNMISDFGGNPVKRDGYRRVCSPPRHLVEIDGVTYGIYATSSATAIYVETLLGYEMYDDTVGTYSGNIGTIRNAFTYQRKIYIIGTYCLLSFDVDEQTFSKAGVKSGQMSINTIGEYCNNGNKSNPNISHFYKTEFFNEEWMLKLITNHITIHYLQSRDQKQLI